MSWFDRHILGVLAPRLALKRLSARRALKAQYDAGSSSTARKRRTDRSSANVTNQRSAEAIRTTARYLDDNYDIASGMLDILVRNTVGGGIWPEPQILQKDGQPAAELNQALLALFEDWRFRPEVTWQHDYFGLQALVARSAFRDGEAFANRVTGPVSGINHGTIVPYSVEALESDFVPYDLEASTPYISQGIELNDWGRAIAYHVYKRHPGDTNTLARSIAVGYETKRVLASTMIHLAFRKRLHQRRGMSLFAAVANRLEDIKEIDENELLAAKIAASMAAYIKKGQSDMYEPADGAATSETGRRLMQFEGGLIFDDLEPGEEIGTIDTTRPNNDLIPFRDAHLRAAAAGFGTSYSSTSKNYNGTWSAQRQELVEQTQNYQMIAGTIVYGFCQPVWEGFVDAAIASGRIVIPSNVDRTTLWDCTHTGPQMPWIDPEKEIKAFVLAMQWKLTSRSRVIRKGGNNPNQINREILQDQKQAEELGIDISGPAPPGQPVPRQDDSEAPKGASSIEEQE